MDPNRIAEIEQIVNNGYVAPSGINPPTQQEWDNYIMATTGQSGQHSYPGSLGGGGGGGGSAAAAPAPSSSGGYPGPNGGGSTPTGSAGLIGSSSASETARLNAQFPEGHGAANVVMPAGGAAGGGSTSGGGGTTSGGGSTGYGSSAVGTAAAPAVAGAPVSVRSIWSQALHDARTAANGDPRAMRLPFEQHPQGGTFANYQAVAQPGFGPAVPNRMPGQPPAAPVPFGQAGWNPQTGPMPGAAPAAAAPRGPMQFANGQPANFTVQARGGAPSQGSPFPAPAGAPVAPQGAPAYPGAPQAMPQGMPQAARPPMPPQAGQPPMNNFSSRLAQMAAQPPMPGIPAPMPSPNPQQPAWGGNPGFTSRPVPGLAPQGAPAYPVAPPVRDPRWG